jgi:Leucine-rich repeat (LRR) protein
MRKLLRPLFAFALLSVATAHAADAPAKHYFIQGDAITFKFGATDEEVAILDTLPDLKTIEFGGAEAFSGPMPRDLSWAVTDVGFAHVAHCRKLENLILSSMHPLKVTDAGLKVLEGLSQLRRVQLVHQPFTDAGIAHLAGLKNLEELWLDLNDKLGDGALAVAGGLPKLRVLRFYQAPLTDAGIARLAGLTELEELQLGHAHIGDDALKTIGTFRKLQTLDLQYTRVTDAGLLHLKGLPLHWLCVKNTAVSNLTALGDLPDMTFLTADSSRLGDDSMPLISRMKKLQYLYISGTQVTDAGFAKLAGLPELIGIHIDDLPLSDASVDTLLSFNKLADIQMNGTRISPAGLSRLAARNTQEAK